MRSICRRLLLLVVSVSAVLSTMPSSASATTISAEGGFGCPGITVMYHNVIGGCLLTASSPAGNPVELRALFGIMYLCDMTFQMRLSGNGEGFAYDISLRTPGSQNSCTVHVQDEANGMQKPWPAEIYIENGCGTGCDRGEAVFSVTGPFGIVVNCHLSGLELRQTSHTAGQLKTSGQSHSFCESDSTNALMGTWNVTSAAPGIEVG